MSPPQLQQYSNFIDLFHVKIAHNATVEAAAVHGYINIYSD